MTDPILASTKLTALEEDLHRLKASAAQSRATYWQLTQMLTPQLNNETVRRVADVNKDKIERNGVISTGISEQNEAKRKADELQRTLNNEPLADAASIQEKLGRERRQYAAYEDAIEFRTREIDAEKTVLAIEYSKKIKPKHDDIMKRLGKPMLEFHSVFTEADDLRRHLIDNGVGLRGLCLNLPEFLSTPNNPYSDLADWFRAMKREGFINSVPKELRLP